MKKWVVPQSWDPSAPASLLGCQMSDQCPEDLVDFHPAVLAIRNRRKHLRPDSRGDDDGDDDDDLEGGSSAISRHRNGGGRERVAVVGTQQGVAVAHVHRRDASSGACCARVLLCLVSMAGLGLGCFIMIYPAVSFSIFNIWELIPSTATGSLISRHLSPIRPRSRRACALWLRRLRASMPPTALRLLRQPIPSAHGDHASPRRPRAQHGLPDRPRRAHRAFGPVSNRSAPPAIGVGRLLQVGWAAALSERTEDELAVESTANALQIHPRHRVQTRHRRRAVQRPSYRRRRPSSARVGAFPAPLPPPPTAAAAAMEHAVCSTRAGQKPSCTRPTSSSSVLVERPSATKAAPIGKFISRTIATDLGVGLIATASAHPASVGRDVVVSTLASSSHAACVALAV